MRSANLFSCVTSRGSLTAVCWVALAACSSPEDLSRAVQQQQQPSDFEGSLPRFEPGPANEPGPAREPAPNEPAAEDDAPVAAGTAEVDDGAPRPVAVNEGQQVSELSSPEATESANGAMQGMEETEAPSPADESDDTSQQSEPPPEDPSVTEPDAPVEAEPSQPCTLDVTVTTETYGGRYEPRNVGAIWISDERDVLVRTLEAWGNRRLRHVEVWNEAIQNAGLAPDQVDGLSSATLSTHQTHRLSWDCVDEAGQVVPDGVYRVNFEVTEVNGSGPYHTEQFEKGSAGQTLQGRADSFADIALSFTPG